MPSNRVSSRSEKEYQDATTPENTYLSGLCTGLFAATAIASSPSLSSLLPIAVQVVLMAYRTGSHVASLAERLSPSTGMSESWTYVVPGAKEAEAKSLLAEFHKSEVNIRLLPSAGPRKQNKLTRVYRESRRPRRPMSVLCPPATSRYLVLPRH